MIWVSGPRQTDTLTDRLNELIYKIRKGPFHDLRSVPKAEGTCGKSRKGLYSGHFPSSSSAGIFSLFRNSSDQLLVPSGGQKILVQPGWNLSPQKISLAENRFLQAGKGAENTNTEKSRQYS